MSDRRDRRDRRVLLTVSGRISDDLDADVAAGRRPRADFRVLQRQFDADVIDVDEALAATGRIGRLLHRFGGAGALLGWFCFRARNRYDVIVTDGEQVGIPLALLCRCFGRGAARHMMIVHILSVPKKAALIRLTRIAGLIDLYVVYCTVQGDFIRDRLGVRSDRIQLSTFMVDTEFFSPTVVTATPRPMICSAGLERRDYPTLMEAVDGLDVDVVIAAASPWSKQDDSSAERVLPANVTVQRFDLFALRELYAHAQFVVMPLVEVDFQAGITTILEAMSMGKPVLCSKTLGQSDTIIDDVNGRYVTPDDAAALRAAITRLLDDEVAMRRLGAAARDWAVGHAEVDGYGARLAVCVQALLRTER